MHSPPSRPRSPRPAIPFGATTFSAKLDTRDGDGWIIAVDGVRVPVGSSLGRWERALGSRGLRQWLMTERGVVVAAPFDLNPQRNSAAELVPRPP